VLYPRVKVNTLIFILFFVTTFEIPAAFMLIYWFVIQLVSGLTSMTSFTETQSVAWFAHVGGFIAGALIVRLFPSQRFRRYGY
jgi:membrane associated rhomboid family serine protease